MLTVADQWRLQQLRSIIAATAQWDRAGRPKRGEPFPGVMPLLVPLVNGACSVVGEAQRAKWWREEGEPGMRAALDAIEEMPQ